MQETKDASSKPKKVNLSDHSSIKHLLDESVSEIVKSRGYVEDTKLSNLKLLIGTIVITIALFAQFYKKKFPENHNFLIGCITSYPFYILCSLFCPSKRGATWVFPFAFDCNYVHSFHVLESL
ncbi:hypothetical protein ACLB2K_018214 [Fragaria x ananassa]